MFKKLLLASLVLFTGALSIAAQPEIILEGSHIIDSLRDAGLVRGTPETYTLYKDTAGTHAWITSREIEGLKQTLSFQIIALSGSEPKEEFSLKLKSNPDGLHPQLVQHSTEILDLNNDGLAEVSFLYYYSNGVDFPPIVSLHLALRSKDKTYTVFGKVNADGQLIGTKSASIKGAHPTIAQFALREWNEAAVIPGREILTLKKIVAYNKTFFVFLNDLQYASGGYNYTVVNARTGVLMKIPSAVETMRTLIPSDAKDQILFFGSCGVGLFDGRNLDWIWTLPKCLEWDEVSDAAFSPSAKKLAFGVRNQGVYVLSSTTKNQIGKGPVSLLAQFIADSDIQTVAASAWVVATPEFKDENTIQYWTRDPSSSEEPLPPILKTVTIQ